MKWELGERRGSKWNVKYVRTRLRAENGRSIRGQIFGITP
jgi:hypothetical protein